MTCPSFALATLLVHSYCTFVLYMEVPASARGLLSRVSMVTQTEPISNPELLTSHQVACRLSLSVRTLWRLVRAGKFPQPIRYNRKLVRWKTADVARYIAELA